MVVDGRATEVMVATEDMAMGYRTRYWVLRVGEGGYTTPTLN